jgi:uncharacterized protein (DUF111 family)
MKKGRPGHRVTVLAPEDRRDELCGLLFSHSTTLGVREGVSERRRLSRRSAEVETPWGPVRVKIAGGRARPEYEDCARIARAEGLTLRQVERQVAEFASKLRDSEEG